MTKPTHIQTLAEVLANMDSPTHNHQPPQQDSSSHNTPSQAKNTPSTPSKSQDKPACPPNTPALHEQYQQALDDNSWQLLSKVEIQQLEAPDKATRYLRWLAFYYLSRRELSAWQLKSKLLAKGCEPTAVDDLLDEFADKGYQSDERCAHMLIREAIRQGRGRQHISHRLRQEGINLPYTLDELISQAGIDSLCDGTILDDTDKDNIDWLKLAVEARCKKYGNAVPTDPKDKARQLRFLQYRGFEMSICFDALKLSLMDLD